MVMKNKIVLLNVYFVTYNLKAVTADIIKYISYS
jgi:hypothetical protein